MEMRHALTLALQQFEGAMLLVSHDRALIRDTTDELWLVADGRLQVYPEDLDTYTRWLAQFRQQQNDLRSSASAPAQTEKVDAKTQRRLAAEQRQRLAPLRRQIEKLEQQMNALTTELDDIESALADADLYSAEHKDRLKALLARQASRRQSLEDVEARWLEASEELEACSE